MRKLGLLPSEGYACQSRGESEGTATDSEVKAGRRRHHVGEIHSNKIWL